MDDLAAVRHRRAVEAVVRAGMVAGDAGAIRALRAHVSALELDAVLTLLVESVVDCMADGAAEASWEAVVRCGHCGAGLASDDVESGVGLAVRALEAAHRGDRVGAHRLVTRLLDLVDVDSRNSGLVWLLRVAVWFVGDLLARGGRLPRVSKAG